MARRLWQVGWGDDAQRAAFEDVRVDHGGVEIRVAHQVLNGSDVLPALQPMGCATWPQAWLAEPLRMAAAVAMLIW